VEHHSARNNPRDAKHARQLPSAARRVKKSDPSVQRNSSRNRPPAPLHSHMNTRIHVAARRRSRFPREFWNVADEAQTRRVLEHAPSERRLFR
jgi:hypothetical protein